MFLLYRYEKNFVPNIALQQGNGGVDTQHDSDSMSEPAVADKTTAAATVSASAANIKQEETDHNQNSPCERNMNSASPSRHSDNSAAATPPLIKTEDRKSG